MEAAPVEAVPAVARTVEAAPAAVVRMGALPVEAAPVAAVPTVAQTVAVAPAAVHRAVPPTADLKLLRHRMTETMVRRLRPRPERMVQL